MCSTLPEFQTNCCKSNLESSTAPNAISRLFHIAFVKIWLNVREIIWKRKNHEFNKKNAKSANTFNYVTIVVDTS